MGHFKAESVVEDNMMNNAANLIKCAQHGVWTTPPAPPADQKPLELSAIDPVENQRIISSGKMSFAWVGCSGDPETQTHTEAVAESIIAANDTSFFYHLGDIAYIEENGSTSGAGSQGGDTPLLWNMQFYAPYKNYPKSIVSIPGNHDGKSTPISNYLGAFCSDPSQWPKPWAGNSTDNRPAMIQPHVYWRLDTPVAYIVGLYANVANGGILDDPEVYPDFTRGPQYQWLVGQLKAVAAANKQNFPPRTVLLAVHYPPYSGASNFKVRGDQSQGPTPNASNAPYLAVALQQAFADSGQRPDAIFSAHAHSFQRLTYFFADGTVMPCLIAGCGGHSPLEALSEECEGGIAPSQSAPFPAVVPGSFQFPAGDSAQVEYYDDHDNGGHFGFVKVTIEARTLRGQFISAASHQILDQFTLDLENHTYCHRRQDRLSTSTIYAL
jgi:acid phosphatase type 7